MSELLPTIQAEDIRKGLVDYLTTTFALAEPEAQATLERFLQDPEGGIFRGPYVRLRLPFRPAERGWQVNLGWIPSQTPYGHQAAAYARLTSAGRDTDGRPRRPQPTLVTTGTGSGKTEAFLHPIIDHVLRAKREGVTGMKALILYPMNALANDQARRITETITSDPALGGIRAALYTGQTGPKRSVVTKDGLINDRGAIHDEAPDILLTNYKMLDQLLLRSGDQTLWDQSAMSLRYLVLDEFHTYDGAQGTDVAMLLRRLGLALKSRWPDEHDDITDEDRARPLGLLTAVATSATLGDGGDPSAMVEFANTVFGDGFDVDSVVTETRQSLEDWIGDSGDLVASLGMAPAPVTDLHASQLLDRIENDSTLTRDPERITNAIVEWLYVDEVSRGSSERLTDALASATDEEDRFALIHHLLQAHPFIQALVRQSVQSVGLVDLAAAVFPLELSASTSPADRDRERMIVLVAVFGALSHVRKVVQRAAPSVDLHLWVRSLTRVDRFAQSSPAFAWADDGDLPTDSQSEATVDIDAKAFPAVYCRHCGRNGWGVELAPTGLTLATSDDGIRSNHANKAAKSRFRAFIFAPREGDLALEQTEDAPRIDGLWWFRVEDRELSIETPNAADRESKTVLPVLALAGPDADEESRDDVCPNCGKKEGIRFLGSAIATQLSVVVTTLFGDSHLDPGEKKALVFTDSVQDAAHRAGFIQSRAHVFNLRNAVRSVVDQPMSLDDVADAMMQNATTSEQRYRLLPPDLVDRQGFQAFWSDAGKKPTVALRNRVKQRLRFDLALEFGLQSRVGRTLEETGSLSAQVDGGPATRLEAIGRSAIDGVEVAAPLDGEVEIAADQLVRWVRGVLERLRERGAIEHDWLRKYVESNGNRWFVWGGRPRGDGMPAFPPGREAPGFARIGAKPSNEREPNFDQATSSQSWYARWTARNLHVTGAEGAKLVRRLFEQLDRQDLVVSVTLDGGDTRAYGIKPSSIVVTPIEGSALSGGGNAVICDTCETYTPGSATTIDQLDDGPCTAARCPGTLRRAAGDPDNYYRHQYDTGTMRRVVAREHTGLLDDATRLEYENAFKSSAANPDAPNVLVATPTLEMGIDIGDLSAVFLAGLPRSVSSYLQRVGRAGRLTGNALILAFVLGRGEQLPKIGDPLSVINGAVRPPATYLNAIEILRRQYTAFVIDGLSARGMIGAVGQARSALGKTEGTSFIGTVIEEAESAWDELSARFLASFDQLDGSSRQALREWAEPAEGERSSGLAAALVSASADWNADIETLRLRREAIEKTIPELTVAAEHAASSDDDKNALRSAKASLGMVRRNLQVLRMEHWVSALERFGVLPNYSLLDDRVQLNVGLSWVDPESGEFSADDRIYERGRSIAISELAPGAHFYAQGLDIEIDAIDLGRDAERIADMVLCPECGYTAEAASIASCPRCSSKAIADTNQKYAVVEMEQVSAEVRRDEATISDRSDDRDRTRFTVQLAADIDPESVVDEWYVEATGLGVKFAKAMSLRWFNLGRSGAGANHVVAGAEHAAPLFRVCRGCGKLDRDGNKNSAHEHRAWCVYRKAKEEHTASVVLSRTLRTQALVLRVPSSMTVGDSLSLPSLSAAIQLGLREVIGGSPDHLRIETCVEPVIGDEINNVALLIHDTVPGGTGYLADLADPERIREIFIRAREAMLTCNCPTDPRRTACDRCLLPFAPGGRADAVSRTSALANLATLLEIQDDTIREWVISKVDPGPSDPESHLEKWFRQIFKERVDTLGASVKEIPGEWGSIMKITVPGQQRTWTLRPQQLVAGTRPDFVLEGTGSSIPPIAIYTDGFAFHASPAHNRIADDAQKRHALREIGYRVLSITWDDLKKSQNDGAETSPEWFDRSWAQMIGGHFGLSPSALDLVAASPLSLLMAWIQDPMEADDRWTRVSEALPLIMSAKGKFVEREGSLQEQAPALAMGSQATPGTGGESWVVQGQHFALLASRSAGDTNATPAHAVLLIDDRSEAVATVGFADAWREWLRLGNLLGSRETRPVLIGSVIASSLLEAAIPEPAGLLASDPASLPPDWARLLDSAGEDESALIYVLATEPGIALPSIGGEGPDGIPLSVAWEELKVALDRDFGTQDRIDLLSDGWTIVPVALDRLEADKAEIVDKIRAALAVAALT